MNTFPLAEALAADLAGAQVDPNEAQKALAYLRNKREGRALFDYLQAVVSNGSAVIRSGRTLGYYRDLLTICQRHLRPLQNDYPQLVATFAWSLRLLRYYRAVSWAAEEKAAETRGQPVAQQRPAAEGVQPISSPPATPHLPAVGEVFGGEVLAVDTQGVRVQVKNLPDTVAIGVIKTEALGGKQYQVRNIARVEVVRQRTLTSGLVVLDLKPAPKKGG